LSDVQLWFLAVMAWTWLTGAWFAIDTDRCDRPPLSWLLAVHYWLADHLARPTLEPALRRLPGAGHV
jgi:hypothetical protein